MATIFERAARKKLRFETTKGLIAVEDLFDLPLLAVGAKKLCLNDMAVQYNKLVGSQGKINFVQRVEVPVTDDKLRFDLIKYVIDYKISLAATQESRAKKAQQRLLILGLIDEKQNDALKSKSPEELRAMLEE